MSDESNEQAGVPIPRWVFQIATGLVATAIPALLAGAVTIKLQLNEVELRLANQEVRLAQAEQRSAGDEKLRSDVTELRTRLEFANQTLSEIRSVVRDVERRPARP
jgi:hypothetical protein